MFVRGETLDSTETTKIVKVQKKKSQEKDYEERAQEILDSMTTKQKVAQMFLVGAPSGEAAVTTAKKYQFGGYVFFANEFQNKTPAQAKSKMKRIQKASNINMLLAVDEEGGTVTRVSSFKQFRSSKFQSPRNVYLKGGWKGVTNDAYAKAKLLKSVGINTNLAPVADVAYKQSDYMYSRSFSTSPKKVSKFIKLTVKAMKKKNLVSTLKHFPGYGNNGNTHTTVIRDRRSKSTFKKRDLLPFQAGINAGCDMIMVSHNVVECFDKKLPASLSPKVIKYLREDMGYEGVIVTDSLGMGGVSGFAKNYGQIAVKAVQAGNDMICTTNYKGQFEAVYKAVKSGEISKKQINQSVKRILKMKLERNIIK
jgi:beta-N-acetylhexosaminidase